MINTISERRAINAVASMFTRFNWIFREQLIADYGVDAIVEKTTNGRPDGLFCALQIKGGQKRFHRGKKNISFYFSEAHCLYWLAVADRMPMFVVLHDQATNELYWQQIKQGTIEYTKNNCKVSIPYDNKLNDSAQTYFEAIIANYTPKFNSNIHTFLNEKIELKEVFKISYELSKGKEKELLCSIADATESFTISLKYSPEKNWDSLQKKLTWEDPYYYTLWSFEEFLKFSYVATGHDTHSRDLRILKGLIEQMIQAGGIEEIARQMFNNKNLKHGIPGYDKFIEAFEYYTKLTKGQYTAQVVGEVVHFQTDDDEFEMNSYESKTVLLKSIIDNRSYDEIFTETHVEIWNEIYIDAGIVKEKFVPIMLREWQHYWYNLYKDIQERVGTTSHLEESKKRSWEQLQIFFNSYNDVGDIIRFAYNLSDMELFPLAVITMMNIFDPDVCYSEYCELEFYSGRYDWNSIQSNDEAINEVLFIRSIYA